MRLRLRSIDNAITGQVQTKESGRDRDASIPSSGTATPRYGPPRDMSEGMQHDNLDFAFEEDLFASRVYRKPPLSNYRDSLVTSDARTTAWSILSGISLTDVSNISVLAVPIYAYEISNSARYIFGDLHPESLAVDDQEAASNTVQQISKVEKEGGFGYGQKLGQSCKARYSTTTRIKGPFVKISYWEGESFVIGFVPLIVCRAGGLLKEKGKYTMNYTVFTSSLILYTQLRKSKTYLVSVGLPVAFR